MSYIGKTPTIGNFQVCDAISVVNGQAAYTMQVNSVNVVPESANHMLVSLNGILQKPGGSFTVSGSTITFSSNLSTGDVIDFITLLGNVLDLGTPSDATVTNAKTNFVSTSSAAGLQIKGDGTTDGTLQLNCSQNSHGIKLKSPPHSASASYTLTFPNNDGSSGEALTTNGSGVLTWASAGGTNTPAFEAHLSSSQSVGDNTEVKLQANTEVYDSDSAYDNSTNYRFTPQTAGKYYCYGMIAGDPGGADDLVYTSALLKKNGSTFRASIIDTRNNNGREFSVFISGVADMNGSSDYVELFGNVNAADGSGMTFVGGSQKCYFGAYKIIT